MSNASTTKKTKSSRAHWKRFDAMTSKERQHQAKTDVDAQPLMPSDFRRMRRTPQAKIIRRALGLTQQEFATRFGIPLGTLRDWEQGATEPDQAARAYLAVIARNPEAAANALKKQPTSDAETRLAPLIGKIAIRWNEIESDVHQLFEAASHSDDRAKIVFYSLHSGLAQRDTTVALLETIFLDENNLRREMRRLFGEVGKAAEKRDNAIHMRWFSNSAPDRPQKLPELRVPKNTTQVLEQSLVQIQLVATKVRELRTRLEHKLGSMSQTQTQAREAFLRGFQKRAQGVIE